MNTWRIPKPAILDEVALNQHTVIEASAGTGKTFTIEHLVVELLLRGEARIDEILVVTFTRRATFELKQRIRHLLGRILDGQRPDQEPGLDEPHWVIDEELEALLQDAWFRFDQAPVYTIHGFCQRVLVEHAFEHQRLFDETHVQDDALFSRAFHDVLRATLSTDPAYRRWLQLWLTQGDTVERLHEELAQCHRARIPLGPRHTVQELERLYADAAADLASGKPDKATGHLVRTATLQVFLPAVEEELSRRKAEQGVFAYDDMLDMVWESLDSPERGFRLVNAIRERYRFGLIDEFQDTDPVQWAIFERIFLASQGRNTFYLIGDPKQAIYGFRGADVFTYLEARDEVVDTGGALLHLRDNYRSTADLIAAYNLLFDQSADAPLFSGSIHYDAPVRCARPALAFTDADGEAVVPIEVLDLQPAPRERLKAAVVKHTFAEAIAADCARTLMGGSRIHVHEEDLEGPRRVEPRDVFVLTRTGEETRMIGEALRRNGVPYAFYKESGLFSTGEAADLLDVLTAVVDPQSRSARYRAYLTPFFGLTLPQLEAYDAVEPDLGGPRTVRQLLSLWHQWGKRQQYERLFSALLEQSGLTARRVLFDRDERALTNYAHVCEVLTEEAHRTSSPLPDLVARLSAWVEGREPPPGDEADFQRLESERNAVQVMTMHKAKGLEADVVYVFGGFSRSYSGRTTLQEEDGQRLEFLSRTLLDSRLKGLAESYRRQEAERLIYVAITRARGRVVLPYIGRSPKGKRLYSYLNGDIQVLIERLDALMEDPAALPPGLFSRTPTPTRAPSEAPDPIPRADALLADLPAPDYLQARALPERAYRDLRERRPIVTSYSSLKSQRPTAALDAMLVERIEPEVDLAGADADIDDLPRGPRFGVLVHHIFEHLPLDAAAGCDTLEDFLARPAVHRVFEDATESLGLPAPHRAYCERIAFHTLAAPVDLGGLTLESLAEVDQDAREVDFTFPLPEDAHPALGQAPIERLRVERGFVIGVVDLLVAHAGRTWFADWKSDLLERYDPDSLAEHVESHYGMQARLYTLAMVKMMGVDSEADYARFGGYVYLFVRAMSPERPGAGVYFRRPSWAEVVAWDEELRGMEIG